MEKAYYLTQSNSVSLFENNQYEDVKQEHISSLHFYLIMIHTQYSFNLESDILFLERSKKHLKWYQKKLNLPEKTDSLKSKNAGQYEHIRQLEETVSELMYDVDSILQKINLLHAEDVEEKNRRYQIHLEEINNKVFGVKSDDILDAIKKKEKEKEDFTEKKIKEKEEDTENKIKDKENETGKKIKDKKTKNKQIKVKK